MITWNGIAPASALRTMLGLTLDAWLPSSPGEMIFNLYKNDITPSVGSVVADFDPADFSGYTPARPLEYDSARLRTDALGNAYYVSEGIYTITQSAATISNVVYGWFLTDSTGNVLYAAKRFPNPINFDHAGKTIDVELAFRAPIGAFEAGDDTTESG